LLKAAVANVPGLPVMERTGPLRWFTKIHIKRKVTVAGASQRKRKTGTSSAES